jgi:DnaJ-class molecular chaperone
MAKASTPASGADVRLTMTGYDVPGQRQVTDFSPLVRCSVCNGTGRRPKLLTGRDTSGGGRVQSMGDEPCGYCGGMGQIAQTTAR